VESSIVNFRLQDLTVGVGTTIQWLQEDIVPHPTTAGAPSSPTGVWDSGFMDAGEEFSFTFDTPGTFAYFCEIHPGIMTATVTVVEGAAGAVGALAPAAGGAGGSPTEGYSD
jgi:plastocyanin